MNTSIRRATGTVSTSSPGIITTPSQTGSDSRRSHQPREGGVGTTLTIDRVFDREYNHQRLTEFRDLVDRRLRGKRNQVWGNTRTLSRATPDYDTPIETLQAASTEDLIDIHLLRRLTAGELHTAVETLVARCDRRPFDVLSKLFPDDPRYVNDWYYLGALSVLMRLAEVHPDVGWLPGWLRAGGGTSLAEDAVQAMISLGVSGFEADGARKTVLLFSAATRRVLKIMCVTSRHVGQAAEARHAAARHFGEELSFGQMIASPKGQVLLMLEEAHLNLTESFVRRHTNERERFLLESAKLDLAQTWALERKLLRDNPNYWTLLQEADLGEGGAATEHAAVTYDQSGHGVLVAINAYPKWRDYTLATHRNAVEDLAAMGSWQAREWLGLAKGEVVERLPDEALARRFFFGDVVTLRALRAAYRPPPKA